MKSTLLIVYCLTFSSPVWADDKVPEGAIRVRGQVTDADTGELIDKFKLIVGSPYNNIHTTWQGHLVNEHSGGRFQWSVARAWRKTRLRIEAAGYLPGISPVIERRAGAPGDLTINFKLRSHPGLTGTVRGADGKPVAGAQVALTTQTFETTVVAGKLRYANGTRLGAEIVLTDESGGFKLPGEADPFLIVAADLDHGFAVFPQADLKAGKREIDMQLQPWCRVEGQCESNASYELSVGWQPKPEWPVLQHRSDARTDNQGRFVCSHVAPGSHVLQRWSSRNVGLRSVVKSWTLTALAGQTMSIDVQTQSRTVYGKLVTTPNDFVGEFDASKLTLNISPQQSAPPRLANPVFVNARGGEQVRSGIGVGKSGEFTIENLPPGRYDVMVDSGTDPDLAKLNFSVSGNLTVPLVDKADRRPQDVGQLMMFVRPVDR